MSTKDTIAVLHGLKQSWRVSANENLALTLAIERMKAESDVDCVMEWLKRNMTWSLNYFGDGGVCLENVVSKTRIDAASLSELAAKLKGKSCSIKSITTSGTTTAPTPATDTPITDAAWSYPTVGNLVREDPRYQASLRLERDLAAANQRIAELEDELVKSFDLAEGQLASEKLAGNAVKENYWRGELAALHRIRIVLSQHKKEQP